LEEATSYDHYALTLEAPYGSLLIRSDRRRYRCWGGKSVAAMGAIHVTTEVDDGLAVLTAQ